MKIKKLLVNTALILGLGMPAVGLAKDFEDKLYLEPYTMTGTSTSSDHKIYSKVGFTLSGRVTENSSIGIDNSIIWEGRHRENSGAIKYTRRLNPYTLSLSTGISEIKLDTPIPLYGDEFFGETKEGSILFLETSFTKRIKKGLSLRFAYQRNFADSEVIGQYPKDRVSIGLEGKIEF